MTDDELEALGKMVSKAEWNTPLYQTYGRDLTDEQERHYKRENSIRIGRSLMLLIHDSDLTLYGGKE